MFCHTLNFGETQNTPPFHQARSTAFASPALHTGLGTVWETSNYLMATLHAKATPPPLAAGKLCWLRTVLSLDHVWDFKRRQSQEFTSTNALTFGSIFATGNQVKHQLTSYPVGADYGDSLVPFLQPLNSQEAINSIYRWIKGYLQNQAFPRKWGSLFDSQCKRNQWGSVG